MFTRKRIIKIRNKNQKARPKILTIIKEGTNSNNLKLKFKYHNKEGNPN